MKAVRPLIVLIAAAMTLSIAPVPACADSWMLPTTTSYVSCGGHVRMTVVPRDLENQLRYFKDKVEKVEPAGQKAGGVRAPTARLERRAGKGWETVWEREIVNEVAPVTAIVRDDGAYAVTFDNWHSVGYGPDVVVIYAAGGKLVRALALSDILPDDYVAALPHSVSSIGWRGEPRFSSDGERVLIPVGIPGKDEGNGRATIEFAVALADGAVAPVDAAAWASALAAGKVVRAEQLAAETARKVAFIAPLLGPKDNTQGEWHDYLREGVARLIGDEETSSTTVLRLPDAKDYAVSEKWVRERLTDPHADHVALASLSEPNLVAVLGKIGTKLPDGSLSKATVFVAVSDSYWPHVMTAMRGSGAKLVQLDPATPIPQRPERIARRYGTD